MTGRAGARQPGGHSWRVRLTGHGQFSGANIPAPPGGRPRDRSCANHGRRIPDTADRGDDQRCGLHQQPTPESAPIAAPGGPEGQLLHWSGWFSTGRGPGPASTPAWRWRRAPQTTTSRTALMPFQGGPKQHGPYDSGRGDFTTLLDKRRWGLADWERAFSASAGAGEWGSGAGCAGSGIGEYLESPAGPGRGEDVGGFPLRDETGRQVHRSSRAPSTRARAPSPSAFAQGLLASRLGVAVPAIRIGCRGRTADELIGRGRPTGGSKKIVIMRGPAIAAGASDKVIEGQAKQLAGPCDGDGGRRTIRSRRRRAPPIRPGTDRSIGLVMGGLGPRRIPHPASSACPARKLPPEPRTSARSSTGPALGFPKGLPQFAAWCRERVGRTPRNTARVRGGSLRYGLVNDFAGESSSTPLTSRARPQGGIVQGIGPRALTG